MCRSGSGANARGQRERAQAERADGCPSGLTPRRALLLASPCTALEDQPWRGGGRGCGGERQAGSSGRPEPVGEGRAVTAAAQAGGAAVEHSVSRARQGSVEVQGRQGQGGGEGRCTEEAGTGNAAFAQGEAADQGQEEARGHQARTWPAARAATGVAEIGWRGARRGRSRPPCRSASRPFRPTRAPHVHSSPVPPACGVCLASGTKARRGGSKAARGAGQKRCTRGEWCGKNAGHVGRCNTVLRPANA